MTPTGPLTTEMADLLESLCLGELSSANAGRLDELVRTDEECCRHYILFMQMHALAERFDGSDFESEAQRLELLSPPEVVEICPSPSPSSGLPGGLWSSTAGYFFDRTLLSSYLAATVLFGIGLVIGLTWRISLPSANSRDVVSNVWHQASDSPVARITALADCRWRQWSVVSGQWSVKDKSPNPSIPVSLGDRFALSSGFMEITYDTGAKVLLEAPCTYGIESARGGFLAIGKLTALVEKGEGRRAKGEKRASSRLSTLDSGLFAVRTPTAIVIDLGTEFGVEVEKSGATRSHVFQGKIELRSQERNSRGLTVHGVSVSILHAGESARVERGRNRKVAITREPGQPGKFVRRIPSSLDASATGSAGARTQAGPPRRQSRGVPSPLASRPSSLTSMTPEAYAAYVLSLKPVMYYRMERPRAEQNRFMVFDDASGHHGMFHSREESIASYGAGRFGDAIILRGGNTGDYVSLPDYPTDKDGRLTIAAWIMAIDGPCWPSACIISHIDGEEASQLELHFGLRGLNKDVSHCVWERNGEDAGTKEATTPKTLSLPLLRWQHVAFVVDRVTVRLYRNGKEVVSHACAELWPEPPQAREDGEATGARTGKAVVSWNSVLQSRIDEVAVFNEALSARTIERLYLGGAPIAKGDGSMNDP